MIKKIIPCILKFFVIVPVVWFALSFVDIVADNNSAKGAAHSKYNIVVLLSGYGKEVTQ